MKSLLPAWLGTLGRKRPRGARSTVHMPSGFEWDRARRALLPLHKAGSEEGASDRFGDRPIEPVVLYQVTGLVCVLGEPDASREMFDGPGIPHGH